MPHPCPTRRSSGLFDARSSVRAAQPGVLCEQANQVQQTTRGYRSQLAASSEQARLIGEELESLRGVAEKGFVSKSRIRALDRKSVGSGKSVSVSVDLGGRRLINKKNHHHPHSHTSHLPTNQNYPT